MPKERVGYRRLYDSMGCSLSNQDELNFNMKIGCIEVIVYMGPKPKRGIVLCSHIGKYMAPGDISATGNMEYLRDASLSDYPHKFFTEIQCIKQIEVSRELSRFLFMATIPMRTAGYWDLANNNVKEFRETADLVAGIIGLRFQRQLVLQAINENIFAIKADDAWVFGITNSWAEMTEESKLDPTGTESLSMALSGLDKMPMTAREFEASVFGWMLRAWMERDIILKFTILFIPLEIILTHNNRDDDTDNQPLTRPGSVRKLIPEDSGKEAVSLLESFNVPTQSQPSGLVTRFEKLANTAQLDGFEDHIAAFKRFNRIRNKLIHQGDPCAEPDIPLTDETLRQELKNLKIWWRDMFPGHYLETRTFIRAGGEKANYQAGIHFEHLIQSNHPSTTTSIGFRFEFSGTAKIL